MSFYESLITAVYSQHLSTTERYRLFITIIPTPPSSKYENNVISIEDRFMKHEVSMFIFWLSPETTRKLSFFPYRTSYFTFPQEKHSYRTLPSPPLPYLSIPVRRLHILILIFVVRVVRIVNERRFELQ